MSQTRIQCDQCGFPMLYCRCKAPADQPPGERPDATSPAFYVECKELGLVGVGPDLLTALDDFHASVRIAWDELKNETADRLTKDAIRLRAQVRPVAELPRPVSTPSPSLPALVEAAAREIAVLAREILERTKVSFIESPGLGREPFIDDVAELITPIILRHLQPYEEQMEGAEERATYYRAQAERNGSDCVTLRAELAKVRGELETLTQESILLRCDNKAAIYTLSKVPGFDMNQMRVPEAVAAVVAQLTALQSEAKKGREDGELADLVAKAMSMPDDAPAEAELKWLFELPMRDADGKRFKELLAARTTPGEREGA